ncbi:DegT/DnrJ/EryC1/StrS aminotransferase family protein [Candidatus Kaiserbacteria bacterium]|nr:DegT/DnrJ/EryC1/StrS aminotransferase family protein [Candidatus Kaiserbacteria bacterium]
MKVPVGKPLFGDIEKQYVNDALDRSEISGFSGGYIGRFEKEFAAFCGTTEAVTVSSGTTALHLALATLKIGIGDEVLVQSFTNMATFFAVLYQGAVPIAIDSEPETLNLNPALLEDKITPNTKAIIVVHIYGQPVDMDPVLAIAKKHNLFVIEDAAEAHGAEYKGRKTGSMGDIGCFSFYANKIITTGEGGMLTMQDPALAARARSLKALAFGEKNKFMHADIGYNYRMTNMQAAIGSAQMTRIEDILARKQRMAQVYAEGLSGIAGVRLPLQLPDTKNVWWMYNLRLEGPLAGKRSAIMQELKDRGVDTREDFIPFNDQEIFIQRGIAHSADCPVASEAGREGFYIPSGTDITEEEQAYVIINIIEVAANLR